MSTLQYLLDTNIVSDMVRWPDGRAALRSVEVGTETVCISAITVCELRFGIRKKGPSRTSDRVEAILSTLQALPFEPAAGESFASLRNHLERRGKPIGPYDMLIAAHALSLGLTLVTANIREFSRIEGLRVENWLEPAL